MSYLKIKAKIIAKMQQSAMDFNKVWYNVKKSEIPSKIINVGTLYHSVSIVIGPFVFSSCFNVSLA